ncbi:MAG: glycosyl hydrolase family 31 [Bacteroidales bacterium]|nr:glycosyl hydrolase family 31 [Bacteroidales bacterium]
MKRIISTLTVCLALIGCSGNTVKIDTPQGELTLTSLNDNAVRVQISGSLQTPELQELIYVQKARGPKFKIKDTDAGKVYSLKGIAVSYDTGNDILTFCDKSGNVILKESSRSLKESSVSGVPCYDVTQCFESPADEHLYGTGQFQDGFLNIRALPRRLTQVNSQIAVPMVLSSKGYGLLWNNYGLTDFNPLPNTIELRPVQTDSDGMMVNATGTQGNRREMRFNSVFEQTLDVPEDGTYALLLDMGQSMSRKQYLSIDGDVVIDITNTWLPPTTSTFVKLTKGSHSLEVNGVRGDKPKLYWGKAGNTTTFHSPVATALDFTVFAGNADECIASYRKLTGEVPLMPEWMFGYIHCRERYSSSDEILENAEGFKSRNIPLDVIVQDWQWWGKYGWNALRFDEDHYPDPKALTNALHKDNVHLMLSVWSKVDRNSVVGKALAENGYYIDGTDWIDFFNPDAAGYYCQNFLDSLGRFGIDSWWFDATEPENDDLAGRKIGKDGLPGEFYRNVYPLMVNKTMYTGLKSLSSEEPSILTRSAFSGIQRYGVVTWSGDVGNDFGTLKREIAGGLGQMATGLPWWTFDAGGFFRPSDQYQSEEYQERMLRWIQVGCFLPFMRVHGYMSRTEPWRYSEKTQEIFVKYINLRKSLQPYIIDCARKVSKEGYTLMRPLLFDFKDDKEALAQESEYMFGPKYLVCPVLEAGVTTWKVYLPKNDAGWEDFWTSERYEGGKYYDIPVSLETIPVFVKL